MVRQTMFTLVRRLNFFYFFFGGSICKCCFLSITWHWLREMTLWHFWLSALPRTWSRRKRLRESITLLFIIHQPHPYPPPTSQIPLNIKTCNLPKRQSNELCCLLLSVTVVVYYQKPGYKEKTAIISYVVKSFTKGDKKLIKWREKN